MAVQANGNQIALLLTFDGEAGADVDMWIVFFLRMARQFNWLKAVITVAQDAQLVSVAKNKLIGKAGRTRKDEEDQKQTFGTLSTLI
jgi:hypothetical protein